MSVAAEALPRRLGRLDAVALGLGGMIGTGVFVVAGPVTAIAGRAVLGCLLLAAAVAACNATSAARLAARYPVSGGAYHWGRQLLHPAAGSVAGWCFIIGKVASAGAAALTAGLYVGSLTGQRPGVATAVSIATVVAVTAANVSGIKRTALVSRVLVAAVLLVLLGGCVVALAAAPAPPSDTVPAEVSLPGWASLGVGAGLFFLAFAGYARIATLGEEVREPRRTIPVAIAVAFGISLVLYALVVLTAIEVLGYGALAVTRTPMADVARAIPGGSLVSGLVLVAAVGSAVAVALGVQAGISRVLLAMARTGEVPAGLSRVDAGRGTPWRADLLVGAVVLAVVGFGGVVGAIALSAATVLVYYAVANAAALRLPGRAGRAVAAAGFLGCAVLAASLLWWAVT